MVYLLIECLNTKYRFDNIQRYFRLGSPGLTADDLKPFSERALRLKFLGLAFTGLSSCPDIPAEKVIIFFLSLFGDFKQRD